MTIFETVKDALLMLSPFAPYLQKMGEKAVEELTKDAYDSAKKVITNPEQQKVIEAVEKQGEAITPELQQEFNQILINAFKSPELQQFFKSLISTLPQETSETSQSETTDSEVEENTLEVTDVKALKGDVKFDLDEEGNSIHKDSFKKIEGENVTINIKRKKTK
jgi:hypothetical protein